MRPSTRTRPAALPRSIASGRSFMNVTISDEIPKKLTACEMLPCGRLIAPMSASQRRTADSISASSTVFRSNVERLMTLSTSAVAVCCWSDSRSSLSFGIGQRRVVHGGGSESVALAQEKRSKLGLAEARRVRQYGLEDRLQFSRRAADNLQHLGGCRLLRARFAQLAPRLRELAFEIDRGFLRHRGRPMPLAVF